MRILAISDLHNNVACVRKLRAQENNDYDVIALGGDIGSYRADEIFKVLRTFKCPIVYVYGNWDHHLSHKKSFGRRCHLIHLNIVRVGSLTFTGFSFPGPRSRLTYAQHSERCQLALLKRLAAANVDLSRTVFMAHDRATHLAKRFPNLLLHLYGHIHTFDVLRRGATTYVNLSALDRIRPVLPRSLASTTAHFTDVRHANAGNYAVIEVGPGAEISVECRLLHRSYENWVTVDRSWMLGMHGGAALISEETIFGDNVRYPHLARARRQAGGVSFVLGRGGRPGLPRATRRPSMRAISSANRVRPRTNPPLVANR
jgi:Icc-related predicted phosphoesterase